jgi:signal transduction histidine kinase
MAYVVDKGGNLIAAGDISRVLKGENLTYLKEVGMFVKNDNDILPHESNAGISKGINGTWGVSNYTCLNMPDWAVVVEMPLLEAYAPILTSLKLTALTAFLSFAIALITGVYLSKRITKPLIYLRNAVGTIGSGDMTARIDVVSNDEIGQLAASFNQMVEDLNKTTVSRDALMEEVAERKQAEKSLEGAVKQLEEANQELKNFVYIASHDLREPLRKVSAFGRILKRDLGEKLSGDDLENLQFMVDGAHRMTQMVEGLLSYSRVSTKGNKFEPVSVNSIIKEIETLELSALLEEKDVSLQVEENLPEVIADSAQLRQLFQNMIANGVKYQPKDDSHKPLIRIWCQPAANDMVRINITDNGIGIKPEFQQAIFIMFKRLHSKNEYEGTGIGLAVCKKIVERNGGQIGVESEYGKGSTFWFTLPLSRQPAATAVS